MGRRKVPQAEAGFESQPSLPWLTFALGSTRQGSPHLHEGNVLKGHSQALGV